MIGKLTTGKNFRSLVKYILNPDKNAELIDSKSVMDFSNEHIIQSFEIQADLNLKVGLKVGHIALSFARQDVSKLTNKLMVEIARDYLECMGIVNTQYIVGRHYDNANPHCHIAFNKVDFNGLRISDSHNYKRNEEVCKKLKLKYGLYFAETKSKDINIENLREPQKTKHEIYFAIAEAIKHSKSWTELITHLTSEQIEVQFKNKRNSTDIQGVSFCKNGYIFSGSKIDKKFSYSKLNTVINSKQENNITIIENKVPKVEETYQNDFTPYVHQHKDDEYDPTNPKRKNNKRKNNKTLNR